MIDEAPLLIRADAGGTMGIGHVMRMIALAQAWQDRGGRVVMASCRCPGPLVSRLREEAIDFEDLGELEPGGPEDVRKVVEIGKSLHAGWVVIDGYHFGTFYQHSLKQSGFKVLAVDDYGHCDDWRADLVLNQNISASSESPTATPGIRFLAGTRFAMLRREFRMRQARAQHDASDRLRILITFGGVDPTGAGLEVLQALDTVPGVLLDLKVLAGPANPNIGRLQQEASDSPHRVELIPAARDMPTLYQWADRVISAGGSTCYEWMFFKLPGWITSVAGNQDPIVQAMLEGDLAAGVQDLTKISKSGLSASLAKWLADPSPPISGGIDGWGAKRVAASISTIPCWVRPVDVEIDARFLFDLANEPSVRSAGRHTQAISWDEHLVWLRHHCNTPQSFLMIVETLEDGPVGQIRFHLRAEGVWEVGVSIQSRHRKTGWASTALSLAILELSAKTTVDSLHARIRSENQASQRLFARLGFTRDSENEGFETWIKQPANI
jgi:UDP-2,4-diacetamido-2,4,6-trideoxy-beta-L-altropyranose hydrolase